MEDTTAFQKGVEEDKPASFLFHSPQRKKKNQPGSCVTATANPGFFPMNEAEVDRREEKGQPRETGEADENGKEKRTSMLHALKGSLEDCFSSDTKSSVALISAGCYLSLGTSTACPLGLLDPNQRRLDLSAVQAEWSSFDTLLKCIEDLS